jgi:hypothetical protein
MKEQIINENAILCRLDEVIKLLEISPNIIKDDVILDNDQIRKALNVSRRTLMTWRTEGRISYSQIGSKIYYTGKDINDFISNYRKKSFFK